MYKFPVEAPERPRNVDNFIPSNSVLESSICMNGFDQWAMEDDHKISTQNVGSIHYMSSNPYFIKDKLLVLNPIPSNKQSCTFAICQPCQDTLVSFILISHVLGQVLFVFHYFLRN